MIDQDVSESNLSSLLTTMSRKKMAELLLGVLCVYVCVFHLFYTPTTVLLKRFFTTKNMANKYLQMN